MRFFKTMAAASRMVTIWLTLATLSSGQQLKINYYSDHYCNNYNGELKYYWSQPMDGDGNNCYNYNWGNSMLISDCYAGSWCVCLLYYSQNCAGDYTSIQYGGYNQAAHYEYNCLFNAQNINSIRCYNY